MGSNVRLRTYPVPIGVKLAGVGVFLIALIGLCAWYFPGHNFTVFNSAGWVATRERRLIIITLLISLIVVVPVFVLLFAFAWKYREGNTSAKYSPELDGNKWAETVWWLIPIAMICVLSVITWQSTHELDPNKVLVSTTKPLTIQVVALQWKWLFIYPEQHVASLNYLQFPTNRPLNFEITADAPMNSFWIPQLGGQIYAMSGMSMPLHLIANKDGDYRGVSANISGKGFADMHFMARSSSTTAFDDWVRSVRQSPQDLNVATYNKLARPGGMPITSYAKADDGLYDTIVEKYMMPGMTRSNGDLISDTVVPSVTSHGSSI
jgi:cytochrome o ubiquinol oxidase subunit 2